MDLEKLRIFYHVAKAGSFRGAAKELNIAQPSLSRSISILEHILKTTLFIRHSNGISLTRAGKIWFKHMKKVIAELETAKTLVAEDGKTVRGNLKISTGYGLTSPLLFSHLIEFLKLYPDLNLHIISNKSLDLNMREADVSFQNKAGNDPNLTYTYLTRRKLQIYASSAYLGEYGEPLTAEDLNQHRLIIFPNKDNSWLLELGCSPGSTRVPYMSINSTECMFQAALQGLGIVLLSDDVFPLKNSNLVHILKDLEMPHLDIYYVYPKILKQVRSIRALEGYLINVFSGNTRHQLIKRIIGKCADLSY